MASFPLTALATAAVLAHLYDVPNKISLSGQEYLAVQQIYRGWSLPGILVIGALVSNFALAILVRKDQFLFPLAVSAFLCALAPQIIFWIFTFPVNQSCEPANE